MRFLSLVILVFAASAFATPEVKIEKTPDGKVAVCNDESHVGNWGYKPVQVTAAYQAETYTVDLRMISLACAKSENAEQKQKSSPVYWNNGLPYAERKSGSRILDLHAVLIEDGSWERRELPVPNHWLSDYSWTMPSKGLARRLENLREGQSISKRLYFLLRINSEENGLVSDYHGGAFLLIVTWTKVNNVIQLSSRFGALN